MISFAAAPVDPTDVVPRRIVAWVIDLVIAFFFLNLLLTLFGVTGEQKDFDTTATAEAFCDRWGDDHDGLCLVLPYQGTSSELEATATAFEHPERMVLALVLNLVLYGLLQGINGASTGKRLAGLVVVDADGRPVGVERSLVRTAMWVVDAITFGLPLIGGILLFTARGHRRLGDQVANTYVVRAHDVGRPVVIPPPGAHHVALPPPPPTEAFGRYPSTGPSPLPPPPVAAAPVDPLLAPTTDGPHWDEARDTYILYSRSDSAWLEWDVASGNWKPIDQ